MNKKRCEANEGCNRKVRFKIIDYQKKGKAILCEEHFMQGIKAWLQPNPLIKHLMNEGIL